MTEMGDRISEVVHLVPGLPQPLDGVGAYAVALALDLGRATGLPQRLVLGTPGDRPPPLADGLEIEMVPERSARGLVWAIERRRGTPRAVILHYVGYGFAGRGCPHWVAAGLEAWRRHPGAEGKRLVTMFHEVYASGPLWRSSFWLSPIQRRIAARLASCSDSVATSLGLYARLLRRFGTGSEPHVLPVFSTVGEPGRVEPLDNREPTLVVFGGAGNRGRVYQDHGASLAAVCRDLKLQQIADLGPPIRDLPQSLGGTPVVPYGVLTSDDVSQLLRRARVGFVGYPPAFLAKSTVHAAYCAHGLLPLSPAARGRTETSEAPSWRVVPGREAVPDDAQEIAEAARCWYLGHRLDVQTGRFAELLGAGVRA